MSAASDPDRDLLAAEYALGVLDGDAWDRARRLIESDRDFAALAERWHERLSPLLDEVAPVAPDAGLWERIARRLPGNDDMAQVVGLHRRLRAWRAGAVAAAALAAALLLVLGLDLVDRTEMPPSAETARRLLVASLVAQDRSALFVVSLDRGGGSLLVSPAAPPPPPGRSRQLWLLASSGDPRPLGVLRPAGPQRLALAPPVAAAIGEGDSLAISLEPAGGSPTGLPTGPVIATGRLDPV